MSDVQTRIDVDNNGTLIVQRTQDVQEIIDRCQTLANAGQGRGKDMHLAADLPMGVIETYCNENGITFSEWMQNPIHVKRMLNDPALSKFRIWQGRV